MDQQDAECTCIHHLVLHDWTIRSYISDVVRTPTRSVIWKWCQQVLDALNYMQLHSPAT
jgi:hypothetical protein